VSLIRNNQSDVRKHLSSHGKKHLHLVGSATEPDATGFSGDSPGTVPDALDPILQSAPGNNHVSDGAAASPVPPKPLA
jgi:hypothetical protein